MNIEVFPTHNLVIKDSLIDKNVIIIDVLRATSVIITALKNGASKIVTTNSIPEALEQKQHQPSLLLGGERDAIKIEGFDFGNSPFEYSKDQVSNKTIILSTTNGTESVAKASNAKRIIAASFLNLSAIVDYVLKLNEDFIIMCSGTNGDFSLDDGLCAGLILHELRKKTSISTTDFGNLLALPFISNHYYLESLLRDTKHIKTLINKGLKKDLDYCLQLNLTDCIPIWDLDGFISRKE